MSHRVLPARPDLEQYKKQAKELVKARATGAAEALERIRQRHPRFLRLSDFDIQRVPFKLSDAQLIIAREHNFDTWPKFGTHIQAARPAQDSNLTAERIPVGGILLEAKVSWVENARGVVLFTEASGSGRHHPSFRYMARELNRGRLCTVLTELLTEDEELRFDIPLLGKRAGAITDWIGGHPRLQGLGLGYFGSGNGAAAAMWAAGAHSNVVRAVVSSGGRPDLAGPWLWKVQAPTLFVVGSKDSVALGFTQSIMAPLPNRADCKLAVIEGAHRLFEEQDALRKTAELARDWFLRYLTHEGAVHHE